MSQAAGIIGFMVVDHVYPRLVVSDAAGALAFYTKALGAVEIERFTGEDGSIVHAAMRIGDARVAVKDADEYDPSPQDLGGTPVVMALDVDDVDAVAEAIVTAGGTVVYPVADHDYGERAGRFADPYGHLWMVSRPLRG